MVRKIIKLLIPALAVLFFSCKESDKKIKLTILYGSLIDSDIDSLYVFKEIGSIQSVLIDSTYITSNEFLISLENLQEGYYSLRSSKGSFQEGRTYIPIYLKANDSLKIVINSNQPSFEGPSAYIQEYNNKAWKFIAQDSLYNTIYQPRYEIPKLNLKEATSVIESVRRKRIGFLNDYFNTKILPEKFKAIEIANIEFDIALKYYWFLKYRKYMTTKGESFEYLKVDSSFYKFLDRIDFNSEINHLTYTYTFLLENYLNDLFFRTEEVFNEEEMASYLRKNEPSEFKFKTNWINDNLHGINRDLGYYALLKSQRFNKAINDSLKLFYDDLIYLNKSIQGNNTNPIITKKSSVICDNYLKMQPGSKSPNIKLPDIDGKLISLNDFKGKVVYIDFWGTWCGPCISAIPHQRNLQKKFSDKEVVFLNIALESGKNYMDKWKKFLNNNDFPGIHVVAENQFSNKEIEDFMINIAPTYVLIDKKGNIVSPRAKNPSEVENEILKLLQ